MQVLENMNKCCGCGACLNKCPVDAITMQMNAEGFLEPVINDEKCINCGACEKVCPALHSESDNMKDPNRYAVAASDKDILNNSSSGGAFTALAEQVLSDGGAVVGAAFTKGFDVHHIVIEDIAELDKLRISKYVQSNQELCYRETKKLLEKGRVVLYTGCPCQIAGLNNFLGKKYDNLYTVDLLCHSIPSPKIFKEHLSNTYNVEKLTSIDMRSREGWGTAFDVTYKNGTVEKHPTRKNIFQRSFLNDLISRRSCYDCQFTYLPRHADFTIGDNWNAKKLKMGQPYETKSSIVLANNERAKNYWEQVVIKSNKKFVCKNLNEFCEIKALNKNIYEPIVTDMSKRDKFYELYKDMSFEEAAYKVMYPYNVGLVLYMSDNYGSCATNYALYRAIEKLGYSPIILDNLVSPRGVSARFAKENLKLSGEFMEKNDYKAANHMCDAFVIGSDQSLRWDFTLVSNNLEYMLMEFANNDKRKIGYAVSFGPERYEMDESIRNLYTHALNRFDALSVREDFAIKMCKKNFDVDVDWVIDPVFLVEQDSYVQIAKKSTLKFEEPYILVYIRHATDGKKELIESVKQQLGLKLIVITDAQQHDVLKKQLEIDDIINKVEFVDWIAYFANASYIITDSFHGTCFSIIFEKRYISLKAGTTQRFDSLANMLGSADDTQRVQIFGDARPLIGKTDVYKDLDYNEIRQKIAVKRQECLGWLEKALSEKPHKVEYRDEILFEYAKLVKEKINGDVIRKYGYEEFIRSQKEEHTKAGKTYLEALRLANGDKVLEADPITKLDKLDEYFAAVNKAGKYTVLISARDNCAVYFKKFLEKTKLPLKKDPKIHNSYMAIINEGKLLFEDCSDKALRKRCILNNMHGMMNSSYIDQVEFEKFSAACMSPLYVEMVSLRFDKKLQNQKSIISINNINYSIDKRGLNIVVIDNQKNQVVDSFGVDLHSDKDLKMVRKL